MTFSEVSLRGQIVLYALAWYPAQRKSAWYTPMCFRLIKNGVARALTFMTFMTFILFRGVFSDKIYVALRGPVSENSISVPPL